MDETKRVLAEMLKENTGRHFLDSGGAYGRNWERNQVKDFENEPEALTRFSIYGADEDGNNGRLEIEVSANLYHWLANRLEYDGAEDRRFMWFANFPENRDKSWFSLVDEYLEWLKGKGREIGGGAYWTEQPTTINSYNEENVLSQTIQFTLYSHNDTPYVLLSIHGGCDVRGGYTRPRAFTFNGRDSEADLTDYARIYMSCESGDHRWDSDDAGSHWHQAGDGKEVDGKWVRACEDLNKYEAIESDEPLEPENPIPDEQTALPSFEQISEEIKRSQKRPGVIRVDSNHIGYCPECGRKLEAYTF